MCLKDHYSDQNKASPVQQFLKKAATIPIWRCRSKVSVWNGYRIFCFMDDKWIIVWCTLINLSMIINLFMQLFIGVIFQRKNVLLHFDSNKLNLRLSLSLRTPTDIVGVVPKDRIYISQLLFSFRTQDFYTGLCIEGRGGFPQKSSALSTIWQWQQFSVDFFGSIKN